MQTNSLATHTVRARHYYYGPKEVAKYQFSGSLTECKKYVETWETGIYHLAHNESSRPIYKIVRIDSLGKWAAREAMGVRERREIG